MEASIHLSSFFPIILLILIILLVSHSLFPLATLDQTVLSHTNVFTDAFPLIGMPLLSTCRIKLSHFLRLIQMPVPLGNLPKLTLSLFFSVFS